MLKTVTNSINASQIQTPITLPGNVTLSTGNLVIGTSGQGVDFAATPGTGTSELFNDYEEGTWTPADGSGAGLTLTVIGTATYIKVGKIVTVQALITYPSTVSANGGAISGLPFAANGSTYAQSNVFTDSGFTFNTYLAASNSSFDFRTNLNSGITNANLSTKFVLITLIYQST
jgi:hypothetical protein